MGNADGTLMDELALMREVAAGNTASFERLYELYEHRTFQYVRTLVRDVALAEELVIDTLLAVWHGAARFESTSRVSTWIFGIARHKAIDAMRRNERHGGRVALEDAADIVAAGPEPEHLAQQRSLETLLEGAFPKLTSAHREVLFLAFFADLPYEEIATLLGLPLNTVKTRVYYAKQELKALLARQTSMEAVS